MKPRVAFRSVPYGTHSKAARVARRLRASIVAAMGVKSALVALGALGWLPLLVAILGDDGLTLAIVAFALPLLGFAKPSGSPS